ncbi:O-antigen ligase [Microbacterium sp. RU33B]|uniref:O-antigen ligase family protein n=1 Tax=Microbacterium sp. RU33B TaxID=1907390 RepID=UPI00095FA1AB|nr:O-antigen ligase family protein [Microbacterium sp. RU33B]SIT88834.1 O-antigen ligase [Microbacterium sp. RU33B]
MSAAAAAPAQGRWLRDLLVSASLARAFTLAVLAAVFSSFAIERVAGRVTYATIIAALCLLAIAILVARRDEVSFVRLVPTTLVAFVGWAVVSVFWSTDPASTFWSGLSTAALAVLAVTIGQVRDTLQTARALGDVMRWLLSISLGLEILAGILLDMPFRFLGIQGRIAEFGPVQGIFGTRNLLGFVAVIALVTFLVEYRTQSVRPGLSVFSVALAGLLAALSDSPTVAVLAVAVGAAAGALWIVRHTPAERRTSVQWTFAGIVVVGIGVAYVLRHTIIAWLGAGSDFSTRAELWATILAYVRRDPIVGFGWFGPWPPLEFPFIAINFTLDQSHATALNAYFDVLLQLGWVGLILFLGFVGIALVRSWLVAGERRSVVYAWTPLILTTILVDSMFESFALAGSGWVLLVICAVRAGHSRSWRERVDALGSRVADDLPHDRIP